MKLTSTSRDPPPAWQANLVKRVTVILNPTAGVGSSAGLQHRLVLALEAHGLDVQVKRTTAAPGSATSLACRASETSDLVLACGGDGTVHEVLQGLAGTEAALGVLPLGTAMPLRATWAYPLIRSTLSKSYSPFNRTQFPLDWHRPAAPSAGSSSWRARDRMAASFTK